MTFATLALFAVLQLADPIRAALQAAEAPKSVRIAFEVELRSETASRLYAFDPRLPQDLRWQLLSAYGEDEYLDDVAAGWAAEAAPDGRLFPDDLRASMGPAPTVLDAGAAWKVSFRHEPSGNDGAIDVWAAERLDATAWLSPETGRFLRIDYELPEPIRIPAGGRLMFYQQTYLLEPDPVYDLSLITSFKVQFEAKSLLRTTRRAFSMRTRNIEVFFATAEAEAQFLEDQSTQQARLDLPVR